MKNYKKTVYIAALVLLPAIAVLLGVQTRNASAADGHIITAADATAAVNNGCIPGGRLMSHAGYGSDVSLNYATGVITYDLNIIYKRCRAGSVSEYAVTGYLGACPAVGRYHLNNATNTYDCLKYTNRHQPGRMRDCSVGGFRCIYSSVWTSEGIYAGADGQPTDYNWHGKTFYNRTATIPNWSLLSTKRQGWADVFLDNLCDYYTGIGGRICIDAYAYISWYNYNLTPEITSFSDGAGLDTPSAGLAVSGAITNNDNTNSRPGTDWRITQTIFAPSVPIPQKAGGTSIGATLPCAFYGGTDCDDDVASGQDTFPANQATPRSGTADVSEYPIGTRICFGLSVRQYNQSTENWRHSALRCFVAGKKPKVNILGGDLFVGRVLAGVSVIPSGRVVTANSTNASGTYGSWVEYALAPTGTVNNMASGSAYVGGSPANTGLLTFVNSGHTNTTCATSSGCYSHGTSLPNIAERFRVGSGTPVIGSGSLSGRASGVYTANGNITISASTIAAGRSVIINAGSNTVTISGDINYATGPFTSASQLPQLLILANNITINAAVRNVDAWLIAPGVQSGTTVTGGVIRTCDVAPASINSSRCNLPLTVNGPVVANSLLMLRTGGSEPGNRRGDPAEVFNFRPDAYIWAMQQSQAGGRVTTVSTKELPPRY